MAKGLHVSSTKPRMTYMAPYVSLFNGQCPCI